MADSVKVHLARPGREREGPFTVLEINQALAAGQYEISDYWAWHEGLPEWVPLYAIEGVSKRPLPNSSSEAAEPALETPAMVSLCQASCGEPTPAALEASPALKLTEPAAVSESGLEPEPTLTAERNPEEQGPCQSTLEGSASDDSAAAEERPHPEKALLSKRFYSGMPLEALEQLFVFTTGDGPSVWESPRVCRMLEAITGAPLAQIRQSTRRDVIFNCQGSQLLKLNGAISQEAWRAMAIRAPKVVEAAQAKLGRTCVCSFPTEQNEIVALVLFYRATTNESPDAGELACGELVSKPC